jgi:thioesterase domain-containing protein/acyl carrier protein
VSEDLSLYNLFVSLFFIQLHQLSGNRRLGLVTPVHNRFSVDSRNTVGLLMELCPYQIKISEEDTFMSVLSKVKRETRETMTYYQYGSGLTFRNDTFDVMFNTHPMPVFSLNGAQVLVERVHPGHGSESLALHVIDNESSGSFLLNFYFHHDVFDELQREQILQSYVNLLNKFLMDRTSSLDDIDLLVSLTAHSVETDQMVDKPKEISKVSSGAPQDLLEYKLIQIWEEILGVKPIGIHDNFFDLGGDSWMATQLVVELDKLTGQYLPLTTLLQMGTISDLARGIRNKMGKTLWSTLITIQPGDSKQPLFCVPGAGGNGLAISRIARHLGQSQPVFMFQIPLHDENDRALFSTIEEMAAHYVEALLAHKPEGPYLLAGYSAGGLVAFEVAQQLRRKGHQIDMLVILDVPAQSPKFKYLRDFTRWLNGILKKDQDKEIEHYVYLRDILFRLNYFLRLGYRDWLKRHFMQVKYQVKRISRFIQLGRGQRAGLTPGKPGKDIQQENQPNTTTGRQSRNVEDGDEEWQSHDRYMRRYFEINNIAVKLYMPQPYPGRIVLFRSREGYRYPEQRSPDRLLGWGKIARDGVEMYEIPGNHMQIVREPSVKLLGELLKECLDRVAK